ncbi:hypothetical protein [Curtobacterium ammoniigenes]|uniref:hypothetical protein n=1 Tax=Curtobacterium ammoniigenes TaxID=395387 RepID=UPI000A5691B8|nr:hypothetical protein [Curtobacterium ammoniigenes]
MNDRRVPADGGAATPILATVAMLLMLETASLGAAAHWPMLQARVAGATDAAAVGAAAAAAGLVAGEPCAVANAVAERSGARVEECSQEADAVVVSLSMATGLMVARARARAGQPSPSAIYRYDTRTGALGSTVYGVPVGPPTHDLPAPSIPDAAGPVSSIDQGVTCQARRSL